MDLPIMQICGIQGRFRVKSSRFYKPILLHFTPMWKTFE